MIRDDKRIESIRLVGVGPFEDTTINFPTNSRRDLAEVHIFTGGNGAGKSTVLLALAAIFADSSQLENSLLTDVAKRAREPEKTSVEYAFTEQNALVNGVRSERLILNSKGFQSRNNWIASDATSASRYVNTALFKNEKISFPGGVKNYTCSVFPLAYAGQKPTDWPDISKSDLSQIRDPLQNHLKFGKSIEPELMLNWLRRLLIKAMDASNDALKIQARSNLDRIIKAIKDIAEIGDSTEFDFALNTETFNIDIKWSGLLLSYDVLPDGLKSIISWIADALTRIDLIPWIDKSLQLFEQPLILFLDEIDIHLHPKWQSRVLPAVQVLFPNAQIFVSTHSPFVVASVEDAWVYEMSQGEKNSDGSFVVKAEKSGAGKSYELVLAETFDITDPFVDQATNDCIGKVSKARDDLFNGLDRSPDRFIQATKELVARATQLKSEQLSRIASLELRQAVKLGFMTLDQVG